MRKWHHRKLQMRLTRQLNEAEQRNLGGIGYIGGSVNYMGGGSMNMEYATFDAAFDRPGHYHLWKPPNGYYPRGEAPPPYEEAVALSHAEQAHCTVSVATTTHRSMANANLQQPHTANGICPSETIAVCENIPPNITSTTNLININISNNAAGTVTSVATGENHQTPAQMQQQQQQQQHQLLQQRQDSKEAITSVGFNGNNGSNSVNERADVHTNDVRQTSATVATSSTGINTVANPTESYAFLTTINPPPTALQTSDTGGTGYESLSAQCDYKSCSFNASSRGSGVAATAAAVSSASAAATLQTPRKAHKSTMSVQHRSIGDICADIGAPGSDNGSMLAANCRQQLLLGGGAILPPPLFDERPYIGGAGSGNIGMSVGTLCDVGTAANGSSSMELRVDAGSQQQLLASTTSNTPNTLRRHHRSIPRQFTTMPAQHHHHHHHHQQQQQQQQQHNPLQQQQQQTATVAPAAQQPISSAVAADKELEKINTASNASGGSSHHKSDSKRSHDSGGGGSTRSKSSSSSTKTVVSPRPSICQCPVQHVPMTYMGAKHLQAAASASAAPPPPGGEMPPAMTTKVISSRPRSSSAKAAAAAAAAAAAEATVKAAKSSSPASTAVSSSMQQLQIRSPEPRGTTALTSSGSQPGTLRRSKTAIASTTSSVSQGNASATNGNSRCNSNKISTISKQVTGQDLAMAAAASQHRGIADAGVVHGGLPTATQQQQLANNNLMLSPPKPLAQHQQHQQHKTQHLSVSGDMGGADQPHHGHHQSRLSSHHQHHQHHHHRSPSNDTLASTASASMASGSMGMSSGGSVVRCASSLASHSTGGNTGGSTAAEMSSSSAVHHHHHHHPVLPPKLHRNRSATHQPGGAWTIRQQARSSSSATAAITAAAAAAAAAADIGNGNGSNDASSTGHKSASTISNRVQLQQQQLQQQQQLTHQHLTAASALLMHHSSSKSLPRRGDKMRFMLPVEPLATSPASSSSVGNMSRSSSSSCGRPQQQSSSSGSASAGSTGSRHNVAQHGNSYTTGKSQHHATTGKSNAHHTLPGGTGGNANHSGHMPNSTTKISSISDVVSKVPSIIHIPSPVTRSALSALLAGHEAATSQPPVTPTPIIHKSKSIMAKPPALFATSSSSASAPTPTPVVTVTTSSSSIPTLPTSIPLLASTTGAGVDVMHAAVVAAAATVPAPTASLPVCTTYTNCSNPKEHFLPNDTSIDDEYLSECENCKSTHGSRYYLSNEPNVAEQPPQETMTLQRKMEERTGEEDPAYYRASSTLPTNCKQKQTASIKNREPWFNTIPGSSSSDDEEPRDE